MRETVKIVSQFMLTSFNNFDLNNICQADKLSIYKLSMNVLPWAFLTLKLFFFFNYICFIIIHIYIQPRCDDSCHI